MFLLSWEKIKESFGFDVAVVIRTKEEFKKLIRNNPFSKKENERNFLFPAGKFIFLAQMDTEKPSYPIIFLKEN